MNKSQVILKRIQADKLFTISLQNKGQSKSLKKLADNRCKSANNPNNRKTVVITSQQYPTTTIKIKQKNTQLSKKTYSNLKIFATLNKNVKRIKSCESGKNQVRMQTIEDYKKKSQQIYRQKLYNQNQENNFTYKPFPKRESFVKNSNAMKFFYQPSRNHNFINFLSTEFQIDVKLNENSFYQRAKFFQNPESSQIKEQRLKNQKSYYSYTPNKIKNFTANQKFRRVINNDSGISKNENLEPWGFEAQDSQFN